MWLQRGFSEDRSQNPHKSDKGVVCTIRRPLSSPYTLTMTEVLSIRIAYVLTVSQGFLPLSLVFAASWDPLEVARRHVRQQH
jgi:hypothetical protein